MISSVQATEFLELGLEILIMLNKYNFYVNFFIKKFIKFYPPFMYGKIALIFWILTFAKIFVYLTLTNVTGLLYIFNFLKNDTKKICKHTQ